MIVLIRKLCVKVIPIILVHVIFWFMVAPSHGYNSMVAWDANKVSIPTIIGFVHQIHHIFVGFSLYLKKVLLGDLSTILVSNGCLQVCSSLQYTVFNDIMDLFFLITLFVPNNPIH